MEESGWNKQINNEDEMKKPSKEQNEAGLELG